MDKSARSELVKRVFSTFMAADRAGFERALHRGFTFTSPFDDHIDRAEYFRRCWPLAGTFASFELESVEGSGDVAFALYTGRAKSGSTFRNVERMRFVGDELASVDVFFGRPPGSTGEAPETEVRALIAAQVAAIQARDAEKLVALYAPDAQLVDASRPAGQAGASAPKARLTAWLASFTGALRCEVESLIVEAQGELAFCHAVQRVQGTRVDGTNGEERMRVTKGLRKADGRWRIVHEHASAAQSP